MNHEKFSTPFSVKDIVVKDQFWSAMMEKVRTHVIPYQWEALNDRIEGAAPSYCMQNYKVAAGMTVENKKEAEAGDGGLNPNNRVAAGEFNGCVFQDSDFAKWIEAVGYSLSWHPDPELEKTADEAIDLVCSVQQPDGYMDTYYIINGLDKRFTCLKDNHELYCLGHLIEGAVAYYYATGKDKLLKATIKYVDCVDQHIGPEEGKMHGYPGHEVIEMALIRLYQITKEEKHLRLAKYFIDQRGQEPLYFVEETEKYHNQPFWEDSYFQYQYYQAGKPVREQKVAEGHAVRAVYLYSGMADVAKYTDDDELLECCETLWNNIVNKQMYITGAIGSSEYGESFTFDYDLPNDTIYGETCASIGLVFFARRMLEIAPKSVYADVMEKALFNGIISGMSLDGKSFFYVNPLEVVPESCEKDHLRKHVKPERQKWFGCACCPPNVARLLASIGSYAYTLREDTLLMHLYMGGELSANLGGKEVRFETETNYPWDKTVKTDVHLDGEAEFTFAVRIPGWCQDYQLLVNGEKAEYHLADGYAYICRTWKDGDQIEAVFEMPVTVLRANPKVRENIGKVAVMRGPVVYCLEEADNGKDLHRVYLSDAPDFEVSYQKDLLDGVVVLTSNGKMLEETSWQTGALYQPDAGLKFADRKLKWIPYYAWANRGIGEMTVWVRK